MKWLFGDSGIERICGNGKESVIYFAGYLPKEHMMWTDILLLRPYQLPSEAR
jgi:hypothetical protein